MRFARRTVTYSDGFYTQRTFMKHTDATGSRASLNICLTYTKKESWSAPRRYPNTWVIIGVIGAVWSIHRSRLEQVGGCRWTTLDYRKHHAFAIHSRPKCWKPNRLQWGWPCSLRCTRNVFRMGGTKADQEELQCHHSENPWKPMKTMENMGCPVSGGLCGFHNRCIPCSCWWTLSSVCSSTSLSKLLSFHAGWMRFAKHIVTI